MDERELDSRVRQDGALLERLDKCWKMIGDMCNEGRSPKMSIPVQWDDEDIYITTTIGDAINRVKELEAIIACIDQNTPLADDSCFEPGITLSEAARRYLAEQKATALSKV